MITRIHIDLAAALIRPRHEVIYLLEQLEADALETVCIAHLPAKNVRHALRQSGLLEFFDDVLDAEDLAMADSNELLRLGSSEVLWLNMPKDLSYSYVLSIIGYRRSAKRVRVLT